MIDQTLKEKLLEAPFIVHNFVEGENNCNYELYLIELINSSNHFMNMTKGEHFKWSEKQDKGEYDATTSVYSIDFKLFATKSTLQGIRETSLNISKLSEGCIAYGPSRMRMNNSGESFDYVNTVAAIRKYSINGMNRIALRADDIIEDNVSTILKNLRTQKNILLFYPYILMFSEPHPFEEAYDIISEAFNEDLGAIRIYREQEAPGYDTYLCSIYDKKLIIFQDTSSLWEFKDSVDLASSTIFSNLSLNYGFDRFT